MILEATRWRKKFIMLSSSHWKPHSSLGRPLEQGSSLVEEEIPSSSLVEWIARNSTPGLEMEEPPPTDFDMDTTLLLNADGTIENYMPNPHRFLEDHLQLIFDMRRSMEDET
jgi:hypothetical protein